ncbi:MAG: outer membrane protein assembly factor BamD, partial [Planctomycetales bacterium]|nr:outer membrane protein assembly factor BamD [Planctomycetales bacterium]
MRLSDAEFGAEHYLAAVEGYKAFITFHPKHEQVVSGYAAFRIGEAYHRMIPDDFWLLPPRYEKDQGPAREANQALTLFLRKYPKSTYVPRAKKMLKEANYRLAEHEWYVATFYWERGKARGAALRLETLLGQYGGVGFDAEALFLLGSAYAEMKD